MGGPRGKNWQLVFLAALLCLFVSRPAHALISDNPHFKIEGLVIVWGASDGAAGTAQISKSVDVAPNATQSARDVVQRVVVTGALVPQRQNRLVALRDFGLHFHVASNTAFAIDAQMPDHMDMSADELSTISFALTATLGDGVAFGKSAQFAHTGGANGGLSQEVRTLADLTERRRVFTGNQRTAARPGSIMDQSVQFDIALGANNTRAQKITPTIIFTVFVP